MSDEVEGSGAPGVAEAQDEPAPSDAPCAAPDAAPAAEAAPIDSTVVVASLPQADEAATGAEKGEEPAAQPTDPGDGVEPGGTNKRKPEHDVDGECDTKRTNHAEFSAEDEVTDTMTLNKMRASKLIGRSGANIKHIQNTGGVQVQVDQNTEAEERVVTLVGTRQRVEYTKILIEQLLEAPEEESPSDAAGAAAAAAAAAPAAAVSLKQEISCPVHIVGKIIGRGGETIRSLQTASGAHILINQNFPEGQPRMVEITGGEDSVGRAVSMVSEIINSNGVVTTSEVITKYGTGSSKVLYSPKHMVGRVIGRQGETVKQLQKHFGVNIQIDQVANPCSVMISGPQQSVAAAEQAVDDLIQDRPSPFGGPAGPGGAAAAASMYAGYAPYGATAYGAPGYYGAGYAGPYGMPPYAGYGPPGYYGAPGYMMPPYGAPAYGAYGMPGQYGQYGQPEQPQQGSPKQGGAAGGGANAWQELKDDQGNTYYYNATTGVSQWERPADM